MKRVKLAFLRNRQFFEFRSLSFGGDLEVNSRECVQSLWNFEKFAENVENVHHLSFFLKTPSTAA